MNIYLEVLGYVASFVVLISLVMSSIKKLRWINLGGAVLFSLYGFMIGSTPTGLMNLGIVFINIFYLNRIYSSSDYFTYLIVPNDSRYLRKLLKTQTEEITVYFPGFKHDSVPNNDLCYISLRNLNAAGALILEPKGSKLEIKLDYALKQYRDFKTTSFIIERERQNLIKQGYTEIVINTHNKKHIKYLSKVDFNRTDELGNYVYVL